jgi:hypothetical protein
VERRKGLHSSIFRAAFLPLQPLAVYKPNSRAPS